MDQRTRVEIGREYVVKEPITIAGTRIKKGTRLFAWFMGQLVMCEVNGDFVGKEYPAIPSRIVQNIDSGKLELV